MILPQKVFVLYSYYMASVYVQTVYYANWQLDYGNAHYKTPHLSKRCREYYLRPGVVTEHQIWMVSFADFILEVNSFHLYLGFLIQRTNSGCA